MFFKRIFVLCLGLLVADLSYNALHASARTSTTADSLYTIEQSQHGFSLYGEKCASCHGADLDGQGPVPPLHESEFLAKYTGQPLQVLFDKIQKTMPADKPGSLSRSDTADIVAYILSSNHYQAGSTALPSEEEGLKKTKLPKPEKQ